MFRFILIVSVLTTIASANLKLNALYKAIAVTSSKGKASAKMKYDYNLHFRIVDRFRDILIV